MNFEINMTEGVCKICKKKKLVAEKCVCLECLADSIKNKKVQS